MCHAVLHSQINQPIPRILPMVFPIKMGIVPNFLRGASDEDDIDYSKPLQHCDDGLCLISTSNRGIVISLIAPPISLDGPSSSKNTVLFDMFGLSTSIYWSFCAASGRLVVEDNRLSA